MKQDYYHRLCVKAISGQSSSEEMGTLDNWLHLSPENRTYFKQLRQAWDKPAVPDFPHKLNIDNAWHRFEATLAGDVQSIKETNSIFDRVRDFTSTIIERNYRPALAAFAIFLVLISSWLVWRNHLSNPQYLVVATLNKETASYTFSDGSFVRLNFGSAIKFEKTFSDIREVYLSGEGFFSVAKSSKPFVVLTEQARTTVLGTKFDVWARHGKTRVTVKEGNVKVGTLLQKSSEVNLSSGEMSVVSQTGEPTAAKFIDADFTLGWLEDKLVFDRMPLVEIVSELERAYDVSIRIEGMALKQRTLTAAFEKTDIDTVLSSLCLALNADFKAEAGTYIISEM